MKAVVHVEGDSSDGTGHRRAEEKPAVSNIVVVQVLGEGGVGGRVVKCVLDEGLLAGLLANGRSGAGL